MQIELPPTLTARYDADAWSERDYETGGSGEIIIEFGGFEVKRFRINEGGDRYQSDGSYYRAEDHANENLSEFVAEKLGELFK